MQQRSHQHQGRCKHGTLLIPTGQLRNEWVRDPSAAVYTANDHAAFSCA
jgi:hypothetical protein